MTHGDSHQTSLLLPLQWRPTDVPCNASNIFVVYRCDKDPPMLCQSTVPATCKSLVLFVSTLQPRRGAELPLSPGSFGCCWLSAVPPKERINVTNLFAISHSHLYGIFRHKTRNRESGINYTNLFAVDHSHLWWFFLHKTRNAKCYFEMFFC